MRQIAAAAAFALIILLLVAGTARASTVAGSVRDATGGLLTGVAVELRAGQSVRSTTTDAQGGYRFDEVASGALQVTFFLPNFAAVHREVTVPANGHMQIDVVLHL